MQGDEEDTFFATKSNAWMPSREAERSSRHWNLRFQQWKLKLKTLQKMIHGMNQKAIPVLAMLTMLLVERKARGHEVFGASWD